MLYILSKQGIRNWLIKVVTDDVYGVNYTHYTVTVYEYSNDKTNFWSNLCNSYHYMYNQFRNNIIFDKPETL